MARRCGCGASCACSVVAGTGATVTGTGDPANPYVVGLTTPPAGGAVTSVNGNTGAVVLDQNSIADTSTRVAMDPTERSKLAGVASGATANQTDSYLIDRSHHTGTQTLATISDAVSRTILASSATPTPTGSYRENDYVLNALAANATFAVPSGTLVDGNKLLIRIKDNGTARTLTWNAVYVGIGVGLPTTTVVGKVTYVGARYNSLLARWDVLAAVTEV